MYHIEKRRSILSFNFIKLYFPATDKKDVIKKMLSMFKC
jgi:hypothetical protein